MKRLRLYQPWKEFEAVINYFALRQNFDLVPIGPQQQRHQFHFRGGGQAAITDNRPLPEHTRSLVRSYVSNSHRTKVAGRVTPCAPPIKSKTFIHRAKRVIAPGRGPGLREPARPSPATARPTRFARTRLSALRVTYHALRSEQRVDEWRDGCSGKQHEH